MKELLARLSAEEQRTLSFEDEVWDRIEAQMLGDRSKTGQGTWKVSRSSSRKRWSDMESDGETDEIMTSTKAWTHGNSEGESDGNGVSTNSGSSKGCRKGERASTGGKAGSPTAAALAAKGPPGNLCGWMKGPQDARDSNASHLPYSAPPAPAWHKGNRSISRHSEYYVSDFHSCHSEYYVSEQSQPPGCNVDCREDHSCYDRVPMNLPAYECHYRGDPGDPDVSQANYSSNGATHGIAYSDSMAAYHGSSGWSGTQQWPSAR